MALVTENQTSKAEAPSLNSDCHDIVLNGDDIGNFENRCKVAPSTLELVQQEILNTFRSASSLSVA